MKKGVLICAALLLTAGCGRQNDDKMDVQDFKWQIDRFDDVKVLRYQVPDFDSLSLRQKKLVYYLSQAALCGRDILYDQKFALNLPIRKTLEEIYLSYGGDNNDPRFKAFEKYLKRYGSQTAYTTTILTTNSSPDSPKAISTAWLHPPRRSTARKSF